MDGHLARYAFNAHGINSVECTLCVWVLCNLEQMYTVQCAQTDVNELSDTNKMKLLET